MCFFILKDRLSIAEPGHRSRWDCDNLDASVLLCSELQLFAYSSCFFADPKGGGGIVKVG